MGEGGAVYARALGAAEGGDLKSAASEINAIIKRNPLDDTARVLVMAVEDAAAGALDPASAPASGRELQEASVRLIKAAVLLSYGNRPSALRAVETLLDDNPGYAPGLVMRGLLAFAGGDVNGAIRDYDRALAVGGANPIAHMLMGSALLGTNDLDGAFFSFDSALLGGSALPGALNGRGFAYLKKGDFEKAEADFTGALKLHKDYLAARVNLGFAYYGNGDYIKAVRDFSKALKQNPSNAAALNGRALAYFKLGNGNKAIVDLDKALAIDPWFEDALYNRASVYYESGEYGPAAGDYSKLIQMKPTDLEALVGRANSRREAGDYERALTDYTRAINLYPNKSTVYHLRGVTFHRKGLYDRALSDYKDALRRGLRSSALYYDLGLSLYKTGDKRGAVRAFTRAIEENPESRVLEEKEKENGKKKSWLTKRKASKNGDDWDKLDKETKEARAALKSAYFQRGVALKAAQYFDKAAEDFTKVLWLDHEDAEALNNRGYLYLVELGQKKEGCEDLNAACTLGECANFSIAKENGLCR